MTTAPDRPGWLKSGRPDWPELPTPDWLPTLRTLHRWTQVVGKLRMAHTPWINHAWGVPLYVDARGLTTSLVPHLPEAYDLAFDVVEEALVVRTTAGRAAVVTLEPKSVAQFHAEVDEALAGLGISLEIHPVPSEIPDATPFPEDDEPGEYVSDHAVAFWQALVHAQRVMLAFRASFVGKASPVHFFWGSFDLAVTRFSGRPAPAHPAGIPNFPDDVAREAYSHEVTSVGFLPGDATSPEPIFYADAYPTPAGFAQARVTPAEASWLEALGEFVLPYRAVRQADDPDEMLLGFFESAHAAAADLAGWDRDALEQPGNRAGAWWHGRRGW
jgi:hypothetical protein